MGQKKKPSFASAVLRNVQPPLARFFAPTTIPGKLFGLLTDNLTAENTHPLTFSLSREIQGARHD